MQCRGDEKKKPPGQAAFRKVLEYFIIIFICLFIFIVQALGSGCCCGCVAG
jgi:hypothetical protein